MKVIVRYEDLKREGSVRKGKKHNVEHRYIRGIRERNRRPYRSNRRPIGFYVRAGMLYGVSLVNTRIGNDIISH